MWRWLARPKGIDNWSLTSLQQRLVKSGGRKAEQILMTTLGRGEKCLRNCSEKGAFPGVVYPPPDAKPSPSGAAGKPFRLKIGLEPPICKPPGVGASLIQDSKWKSRLKSGWTDCDGPVCIFVEKGDRQC